MKSVFRYYGGKFNQLKDILAIMGDHREAFDVVVDITSLNLSSSRLMRSSLVSVSSTAFLNTA